jgi:short-subunit dehydrogenase
MTRTILLTGAASGIGRATARLLAGPEHRLVLVDRDSDGLERVAGELTGEVETLVADLGETASRSALCERVAGIAPDALINNAGILNFAPLEALPIERAEAELRINVLAPIALTQAVLPGMRARERGQIVNVGSVFGSIAFAYFSTYSATKFAIRGFTEALRREVAGTPIRVSYVAPRAVRTALANQFGRMAEKVGMNMDPPERVARAIVDVLARGTRDRYVGFPESFFVKVNALFPRLVDRALRKQDETTRPFAEEAARELVKPERRAEWAA